MDTNELCLIFLYFRCHNIHVNGTGDGDCQSVHSGKKWCYIIGVMILNNF
jgi:hypothetical protein